MKTQIDSILEYMLTHKGITSLQAIKKFGATRLSGIIYSLKEWGYDVQSEWVTVKTRFGETHVKKYYL